MAYKFKFKGFSLVEALMALLILTIIFVLAIPFFTKKSATYKERLGRQSEAFYFEQESAQEETDGKCYTTTVTERTINTEGKIVPQQMIVKAQGRCQKYEFIIPKGVHKIDLALVAGGGGGGGAAGGVQESVSVVYNENEAQDIWKGHTNVDYKKAIRITKYPTPDTKNFESGNGELYGDPATGSFGILGDTKTVIDYENAPDNEKTSEIATIYDFKNIGFIKKITINALIGMGTPAMTEAVGGDIKNSKTGTGGNSGYAITDFDMTRSFLVNDYKATEQRNWFENSNKIIKLIINNIKRNVTLEDEYENYDEGNHPEFYGGLGLRLGDPTLVFPDPTLKFSGLGFNAILVAKNGNAGNFNKSKKEYVNNCTNFDYQSDQELLGKTQVCSLSARGDSSCYSYKEDNNNINPAEGDFLGRSSLKCRQGSTGSDFNEIRSIGNVYNAQYAGGVGGYIQGYLNSFGSGANGDGLVCDKQGTSAKCYKDGETVKFVNGKEEKIKIPKISAGGQYGKVTALYEYPGHVGKGGNGGDAIYLKDFPVIPGSKYTIYVGAGGHGGIQGSVGKLQSGSSSESAGSNGQGGSSTALYDEDGNLIVMVIGGAGGFPGHVRTINEFPSQRADGIFRDSIDTTSPRQHSIVIMGNGYANRIRDLLSHAQNDGFVINDDIQNGENDFYKNIDFAENINNENATRAILRYNYTKLPAIKALNTNNEYGYAYGVEVGNYNYSNKLPSEIKHNQTGNNYLINDDEDENPEYQKRASFARFARNVYHYDVHDSNGNSLNYTNNVYKFDDSLRTGTNLIGINLATSHGVGYIENNGVQITSGSIGSSLLYNGFYYRYMENDEYMYSGGLGGFSGLGSKTGCGGGFVGNLDGIGLNCSNKGVCKSEYKGAGESPAKNIFVIKNVHNNKSAYFAYQVPEYFDKCTLNSPDGQTADFVGPKITTVEGLNLGQAGAGGGGGGWSTKYGAGRGGNGQNGYAFISWKKK